MYLIQWIFPDRGFPDSSVGKESAGMQETPLWLLGWEDPLEKGWATHSGILESALWLSWERVHLQWGRSGLDPRGEQKSLPTPVIWPGEFHGVPQRVRHNWVTCIFTFNTVTKIKINDLEGNWLPEIWEIEVNEGKKKDIKFSKAKIIDSRKKEVGKFNENLKSRSINPTVKRLKWKRTLFR